MTNEQLAQLIATLITDFIRPNAQQHLQSMDRLDRIEGLLERHAEVIAGIDIKLDSAAALLQKTAQAQSEATQRMSEFDSRLEDTRQLVAQNASGIAQLTVKQDRNAQTIEELTVKQDRNAQAIEELTAKQKSNASQIEAIAELTRTQLAGIISNGRRIDRLEQQAS